MLQINSVCPKNHGPKGQLQNLFTLFLDFDAESVVTNYKIHTYDDFVRFVGIHYTLHLDTTCLSTLSARVFTVHF